MLNDKKTEKVIETKITFLQINVRKTLIAKKNRFRVVALQMFETIIVELFFVLTKNVNASLVTNLIDIQSTSNNIDKSSTNNNANNKKIKIKIVSLKIKKLKFKKIKFYFGKSEKKHIY